MITLALGSVLRQESSDFELIIIDDASTDNTEEIVKKYLIDRRVKYIKIAKSSSIAQGRNSAWPYVTGKYIAVLDSDDFWCDNLKLTKQYNFLENHPKVALVGGGAMLIDDQGRELGIVIKPELDVNIKKHFFIKNPFFHSSVMYRYEAVKRLGGYDERINFGEDWDLWLRLGKDWELHNLPEVLIKYRVHGDNEASKHRYGAVCDVLRIIKKNRKIYNASRLIFLKKILDKFLERFRARD